MTNKAALAQHSPDTLRRALGHYATGVVVVLIADGARFCGVTINSFTSISLDPPLILWALSRRSGLLSLFARQEHFSVNVLGANQQKLAERLSQSGDHVLDKSDIATRQQGQARLQGSLMSLDCTITERLNGGDHVMFLAQIEAYGAAKKSQSPLVYYRGQYQAASS